MFLENKYSVWYFRIIENAKKRTKLPNIYYEMHHIIPKSMEGKETINLTAKEQWDKKRRKQTC